jgi:hypothetical protein
MSKTKNIKIVDGFVWLLVTDKAKEVYGSGLFTLFRLYDDGSESEIDTIEHLNNTLSNGLDVGIEVGKLSTDVIKDDIAREFSNVLLLWLGILQMRKVNELNEDEESSCCHSHDFCDANMAMDDAFTKITGRELNLQSESDKETWSVSWEIAKTNKFYMDEKDV